MAIFHQNLLAVPNKLSIVSGVNLGNSTTDAVVNLSINSHRIGDMILVMTANNTATAPALLSGYTNILNINSPAAAARSLRLQYKIANNSTESISWTGGYGYMCAIRFASRIGSTNTIATTTTGTGGYSLPNVSNLNSSGEKLIISGHYFCDTTAYNVTASTSPYVRYSSLFYVITNNTNTDLTGKLGNTNVSITRSNYTIEVL